MARGTAFPERESTDYLPNLDSGEKPLSYKQLKLTIVSMPVATVSEREFKSTVEMEAFLEEEIVIRIHPSGDMNAPAVVPVGCNGEQVWLPRGRAISIPRKFIESLTRYETAYRSEETEGKNNDEGYREVPRASQPYPFTVIRDPHPKGRAWLARVMRGG